MIQWARRGNRQQTERWLRALRALLAVLLVVLLAYVVARTIWMVGHGPNDPLPDSNLRQVSTGGGNDRSTGELSSSRVESWRLFGEYQAEEQAREQRAVDAPDTSLSLELLGLFQTLDREQSSAIIAEKGGDAELYHVGDSIPGNAELEEIYIDRVILRRQGRLEALRLAEAKELSGSVSQVREPESEQESPSESTDLDQQRTTLIRQLGLEAVSEGNTEGYSIGQRAPRQLIEQVGLEEGDVVLSVNGYDLGTEESDLQALQSYQETQAATIVVRRGEQEFTVNYPP